MRKRIINKPKCLIEQHYLVHYAFSCAEQVENYHETSTYAKAVVSVDHKKWNSAMHEEMQLLENDTWNMN